MDCVSNNMLCVDSSLNKKENWLLLCFQDGRGALVYASVFSKLSHTLTAAHHLFPFPPEALTHTAYSHKHMALAQKLFAELVDKEPELWLCLDENLFVIAMLKLCSSIHFEEHHHVQPSLTDCVFGEVCKIPCVTCEDAFLFTISFRQGQLHLRLVVLTLEWDDSSFVSSKHCPFQELPA